MTQRGVDLRLIAAARRAANAATLLRLDLVRHPHDLQRRLEVIGVGIDADDETLAGFERLLLFIRRLRDVPGEPTVFDASQDAGCHAAVATEGSDLREIFSLQLRSDQ